MKPLLLADEGLPSASSSNRAIELRLDRGSISPSLMASGRWFGCGLSHSGTANYCRLVGTDGKLVFGGEYLSCATHSPIAEEDIHLVPPRSSGEAWLFTERSNGVIGVLVDGEILLPVTDMDKCAEIKARPFPKAR